MQRRGKGMHQGSLSADFLHKAALSQKYKMDGSVHQHSVGGGGGGGFSVGVYRSELSLDLKQSSDSAVTTSWGSPFQPGNVLGKVDICLYCVLQDGMS